jgi:hypothetical protein
LPETEKFEENQNTEFPNLWKNRKMKFAIKKNNSCSKTLFRVGFHFGKHEKPNFNCQES